MNYFVRAEDFVAALVGPFDTKETAEEHVKYCEARGDSAKHEVIAEDEVDAIDYDFSLTPEEDKEFDAFLCQ